MNNAWREGLFSYGRIWLPRCCGTPCAERSYSLHSTSCGVSAQYSWPVQSLETICGLAVVQMAFVPVWDCYSFVLHQMTPMPGPILSISVIFKRSEISFLLLLRYWERHIHLTSFPEIATVPYNYKHFLLPPIPFLSPPSLIVLKRRKSRKCG